MVTEARPVRTPPYSCCRWSSAAFIRLVTSPYKLLRSFTSIERLQIENQQGRKAGRQEGRNSRQEGRKAERTKVEGRKGRRQGPALSPSPFEPSSLPSLNSCLPAFCLPALRESSYAVTSEPIGSPLIARLMLPGVRRLNTTIGRRLSMHSEIAVASITLRPRSRTCRYEIRS